MSLIIDYKTGSPAKGHKFQMVSYETLFEEDNPDIEYIDESHEYKKEGFDIPSSTQVLKVLSDYEFKDTYYADRGTLIHKCFDLFLRDELDYKNLDKLGDSIGPEIKGFVDQFKRFLAENDLDTEPFISEQKYYSAKHKYAGTIDVIFPDMFPGESKLWLLYFKMDSYKIKDVDSFKQPREHLFNDFLAMLRTTQIKQTKYGKILKK